MESKKIENPNESNIKANELKIELYPENNPIGEMEKYLFSLFCPMILFASLDENKQLAFPSGKVPLLYGFYTAHCNHYPIRIKPDDIWLLIVQSFSNHVDANSELLRELFVNFKGKKILSLVYDGKEDIKDIDKKTWEDFSVQINETMKEYLGGEMIQILTSDFSTTNIDNLIVSKLSIMGAFKKYFLYKMRRPICGIPYIILEGTADDYKKIKEKAEKLSKFEFDWYINRIIPHIQKMIDAKIGKIDNDYFRNIIQRNEVKSTIINGCLKPRDGLIGEITGWILDFFAYEKEDNKFKRFNDKSLLVQEFDRLASQILNVPLIIEDEKTGKIYKMNYWVGFFGCDQNEKKEVFPVQAWMVSENSLDGNKGFKDPIPPKFLDN